jgi:hypothetical protein
MIQPCLLHTTVCYDNVFRVWALGPGLNARAQAKNKPQSTTNDNKRKRKPHANGRSGGTQTPAPPWPTAQLAPSLQMGGYTPYSASTRRAGKTSPSALKHRDSYIKLRSHAPPHPHYSGLLQGMLSRANTQPASLGRNSLSHYQKNWWHAPAGSCLKQLNTSSSTAQSTTRHEASTSTRAGESGLSTNSSTNRCYALEPYGSLRKPKPARSPGD